MIVGGVVVGMSVVSWVKCFDLDVEVVVFECGDFISYGVCGLFYVLGGVVGEWDDLIVCMFV